MEFNLPSKVSGEGCSLQCISWAWGVGMDQTWGAWSSAWGRGVDQRRAQEVVGQWEMLMELRNFVRDDAYFGDGVTCESQERRC